MSTNKKATAPPDPITPKVRKVIATFRADAFELRYSSGRRSWYASAYRHSVTQEEVIAELARFGAGESVALAAASDARQRVAARPIAKGEGASPLEAVTAMKACER